jgi:hypothetical protein
VGRRKQRSDAADEQRNVGALATAVCVQLIEHEERQAFAVPDHVTIDFILTRHQVLEHHEVGEQDVGRSSTYRAALISGLLARVSSKCDWPLGLLSAGR